MAFKRGPDKVFVFPDWLKRVSSNGDIFEVQSPSDPYGFRFFIHWFSGRPVLFGREWE